ncbi:MAG: single-stranded DNA-binding protein [Anaeroplasmataceae bacterium]|nr:single-stranded DNA-binding protein [Anaeroplasmataceae bacterium]MDE6242081.1 single-stranded DNA-binding protein [Anaeroplasmataceae bacterium]
MNKVMLIGRITKDPEIRYTQSGMSNLRFTVAIDRVGSRDANGNRQADFINCVAFGQQADFISRFIRKGYLLSVEGRIQTGSYQGQDNQTRYTTDVIVERVENLTPRDPNAQPTSYQPNQGYQQPNNNYQGYNTPNYGGTYNAGTPTSQPEPEAPQSFNMDVADDDLPF